MKKILCVDDNEVNLLFLEAIFQTHNNYETISVKSGKEALSTLVTEHIDLILLDIMMPDMNGFETATLITSNKKTNYIPIIFLTSVKDQDTLSKCYAVGGADYLHKPYSSDELLARINFHLEVYKNKKIIEQEKALTQEILDMQDNLILLSDGKNVTKVNKAVLNYFNIDSHEEFILKYDCLSNLFIKEDGYFYIDEPGCSDTWTKALVESSSDKEYLVLINDEKNNTKNSFAIKVKKFNKKYLVSLTDVSFLAEESHENELAANLDELTKIPNRLKFNKEFKNTINSIKDNESFSIILFDIDSFKYVNDTYGHLVGDDVLVKLSLLINSHTRSSDLLARWGGEEFVILLHGVHIQKAIDIAEYLRSIIEVEHFDEVNNITCSFGVSEYKKDDNVNLILKRVDEALYEAKEGGRNKVCSVL